MADENPQKQELGDGPGPAPAPQTTVAATADENPNKRKLGEGEELAPQAPTEGKGREPRRKKLRTDGQAAAGKDKGVAKPGKASADDRILVSRRLLNSVIAGEDGAIARLPEVAVAAVDAAVVVVAVVVVVVLVVAVAVVVRAGAVMPAAPHVDEDGAGFGFDDQSKT
ncbi:hypothetical protein B0T24DRAFT_679939 [Lasiosphaeria ovina]|uniref:Uncharacterized protein n=1 Tax=Lasiosphaeria ovina TaxID=92902 RepID=A0AAE0K6J2_9PEZI|nr:hypothetical protein B0T24DRAFT_679939 [Lasiosphaeria ovina]